MCFQFDEREFVPSHMSEQTSTVINATINQTLNTVKRAKRPSIIPAQRFKGKTGDDLFMDSIE